VKRDGSWLFMIVFCVILIGASVAWSLTAQRKSHDRFSDCDPISHEIVGTRGHMQFHWVYRCDGKIFDVLVDA